MALKVMTGTLVGVDAVPIEVEVDLLNRLPRVCVVGLAASAVKEAAERVRSAIASAGCTFPRRRVVINLAPADLPKRGTAFDLPIAVGILAADDQVPAERLSELMFVGELSLAGELRSGRGAVALAALAKATGRTLVMPRQAAGQAALVSGAKVIGTSGLADVVSYLRGESCPPPIQAVPAGARGFGVDLSDVRGQLQARRALEIAAAGAHHLLLIGPQAAARCCH